MNVADIIGNGHGIPIEVPHFGIEIEVEHAHTPEMLHATLWDVVHDGSLRNNGIEFLSRRPFTKREVEQQVPIFYEWMRRHRFESNIRTSTHVHVNVLGKTPEQIAAACAVYTLVEPMMFRYCGRLREENIYCVPWYRATDELECVAALASGSVSNQHLACKYSALYLEPVSRFGTMEFRHAPVFNSTEQLLVWVDMCERVVYSGFDTIEEVLECQEELSTEEFVEGIFGEDIARILRGVCDASFEELMEEYDVVTTAELALACTYKPTEWFTPQYSVEGEGTQGYHRVAQQPVRRMYSLEELDEEQPEEYYEDEEEY